MLDELRGQLCQVDLVDVHFLFLDEVKQQIERTLENFKLDFVFRHERRILRCLGGVGNVGT